MSKTKRREQAKRRAQAARSITPTVHALLHDKDPEVRVSLGHSRDCTNMEPHYCPPSLGQIGFQMCNVPDDLTNYSRIELPHVTRDHETET